MAGEKITPIASGGDVSVAIERMRAQDAETEADELARLDAVIAALARDVEEATLAMQKHDGEYERLNAAAGKAFNMARQARIRYNVRITRLEQLKQMRDETVLI